MSNSVRVFDDGAWISVNGDRVVGVAEVWTLPEGEFCDCAPTEFLVEAFTDATLAGEAGGERNSLVVASPVGRCLTCGTSGGTVPLVVGEVDESGFEAVDEPAPRE